MARPKQIISELKASGADARDAERALDTLCLRVIEDQWLALLEKHHTIMKGGGYSD